MCVVFVTMLYWKLMRKIYCHKIKSEMNIKFTSLFWYIILWKIYAIIILD